MTMTRAHTTSGDAKSEQLKQVEQETARDRLLALLPVSEQRLDLAGVSTAVLQGGAGTPIVLLHGPAEHATKWIRVIPDLVTTNQVVAPDMPGHGASVVSGDGLSEDAVLTWLGKLIERTCPTPPVLVGQLLGGAVAARFASRHGGQLNRLVLVDTFGLAPFQPAPKFGAALADFVAAPSAESHDRLWRHCAYDFDRMRKGMGGIWDQVKAYNLDRAGARDLGAIQHTLMEQFGMPPIPHAELEGITIPTTLIWRRHDLATPLAVAQNASARLGWPLYIVESAGDDPPMEQPSEFLRILRVALAGGQGGDDV